MNLTEWFNFREKIRASLPTEVREFPTQRLDFFKMCFFVKIERLIFRSNSSRCPL